MLLGSQRNVGSILQIGLYISKVFIIQEHLEFLKLYHENNNFINPLNTELNPICHLLSLLGSHHIFHVSKIRVKLVTFQHKLLTKLKKSVFFLTLATR
jgi:transposase